MICICDKYYMYTKLSAFIIIIIIIIIIVLSASFQVYVYCCLIIFSFGVIYASIS